mmetsp:Transcript_7086/g.26822  ORF Transcript_7086/g.26822 Transcript_7086/m.26822 type:complete len:214 (-) Transcript_7086:341-982(-)
MNKKLPPGFSTLRISAKAFAGSNTLQSVKVHTTASAEFEARGSASATPCAIRSDAAMDFFLLVLLFRASANEAAAYFSIESFGSTPTMSKKGSGACRRFTSSCFTSHSGFDPKAAAGSKQSSYVSADPKYWWAFGNVPMPTSTIVASLLSEPPLGSRCSINLNKKCFLSAIAISYPVIPTLMPSANAASIRASRATSNAKLCAGSARTKSAIA